MVVFYSPIVMVVVVVVSLIIWLTSPKGVEGQGQGFINAA